MRTVEEFTKIVREENRKHNEELLSLNPATLINRAWKIAKWQAIYEYIEEEVITYLENGKEEFEDFLTLEIDDPISTIYGFEFEYDEPMWTTWDNLDLVVREMFVEIKITTKKQKGN